MSREGLTREKLELAIWDAKVRYEEALALGDMALAIFYEETFNMRKKALKAMENAE